VVIALRSTALQAVEKIVEQELRVMGSGRRFGVELYGKVWMAAMTNSFVTAIIGVEKPRRPISWEGYFINSVTVILRSDVAPLSANKDAGLILPAMAKWKFVSLRAGGQSQYLMAKTNAE
jgi:hypothetical protein